MNEFIFNIKQIFDIKNGVLNINSANYYYIAPYQRGYKWGSESPYDAVCLLLNDLISAFRKDNTNDYYLQYITVKRQDSVNGITNDPVLEVIDGQQRLTTLSLFFYVLNDIFPDKFPNYAKNTLIYARHSRNGNPLADAVSLAHNNAIADYDSDKKICQEQDFFYMVRAIRYFHSFINGVTEEHLNTEEIDQFIAFILEKVQIIVNLENAFISEEDIFANLNDNKVPLTDSYLIKGLLLTKAVIKNDQNDHRYNYQYIVDQRRIMGRMWDEIQSWIDSKTVKHFFFSSNANDDGMNSFLRLLLPFIGLESAPQNDKRELLLFNHYNKTINSGASARAALEGMKKLYRFMKNCYEDVQIYNLLGFVRFTEPLGSKESFSITDLFGKGRSAIIETLSKEALLRIPDLDKLVTDYKNKQNPPIEEITWDKMTEAIPYNEIGYGKRKPIYNLLFSLSVFVPGENHLEGRGRYDFYSHDQNKWTYEHISPQNPNNNEMESISEKYNPEISENESYLHSAGNMALLSDKINPSVSNDPFCDKRIKIQKKSNEGFFIPRHTKDVFSKLFEDEETDTDFTFWTPDDLKHHLHWMWRRTTQIRKSLTK